MEEKQILAKAMIPPHKNCGSGDYHDHKVDQNTEDPKIMIKSRAVGAIALTTEHILEKKKLQLQENANRRRIRKSVKNKALKVAKSKRARWRVKVGATAQELQTPAKI